MWCYITIRIKWIKPDYKSRLKHTVKIDQWRTYFNALNWTRDLSTSAKSRPRNIICRHPHRTTRRVNLCIVIITRYFRHLTLPIRVDTPSDVKWISFSIIEFRFCFDDWFPSCYFFSTSCNIILFKQDYCEYINGRLWLGLRLDTRSNE